MVSEKTADLQGRECKAGRGCGQLQGPSRDCDEQPVEEHVAIAAVPRLQWRYALELWSQGPRLGHRRYAICMSDQG